ncbi:MAG: DUF1816 domain-containing protein [Xenococcaceae cyanobacterium MO_188.B29]|nr:DUF1816 domain-containing protein [Xenococcaceae cyanobacterium MO_188.B29]
MNQQVSEFGWWIKIVTSNPMYVYYFGVFDSYYEAVRYKNDYIQDLSREGSFIIDIQINRCQPKQLTICIESISA